MLLDSLIFSPVYYIEPWPFRFESRIEERIAVPNLLVSCEFKRIEGTSLVKVRPVSYNSFIFSDGLY